MAKRPHVLVISFSPIIRDARVLRELEAVSRLADITSIGYGAKPPHVVEHLQIPDSAPSLPQTIPGVAKLAARRLAAAELAAPATQYALKLLAGRTFDTVVANDARAIPLAFKVAGNAPVWTDLHEYAPEERTHVTSWRLLVAPLMDHICRKYLRKCAAVTTVGGYIAELYHERYGVKPELVRNVGPFRDLAPTPVAPDGPIRLVHSGAAVYGRNLEDTIQAVVEAGDGFTLDLYLVSANDGGKYLAKLHEVAKSSDRITFHDPVPPDELPATLNAYDVGVFWIPPFNTNARLTLPNKIFDYIQACLAIAVGPTIEMQEIVERYNLGMVSTDYEVSSMVSSLQQLNGETITEFKRFSAQAARELNFENESVTIERIIARLTQ